MSNALKNSNFEVYDKKSGNKIGTVHCNNFQRLANALKPKATAAICFVLMMGSMVNLTAHGIQDVVEHVSGVDNVRIASELAMLEAQEAATIARVETSNQIRDEILINIEQADKAIAKISNTNFVSDGTYIDAVDKVSKIKEKMFVEKAVDYMELYEMRELSRDICESILEILNKMSTGNSRSQQVIEGSRYDVVPPDVRNDNKRSIYKVEAVRRGYNFHPKTNNQMVGGRR